MAQKAIPELHDVHEEHDDHLPSKYTDLTYLKPASSGTTEFLEKMISTSLTQNEEDIANLNKYLKEEDWEKVADTVHKMKPSFHFIGVKELQNTLIDLERFAHEKKNLEEIPFLVEKVGFIFNKTKGELDE